MTVRPDNENYPAAYWFWHTVPTTDEIQAQVRQMAEAGFKTFLIQARLSFPREEYLSEAYFQAYRAAMDEARRLGLTAGIYDDYNFISGHAAGKTVWGRDDVRERHLFWSSTRLQERQGTCTVSGITSMMFDGFGAPARDWLYEGGRPAWGRWGLLAVLGRPAGRPVRDLADLLDLTEFARLTRAGEDGCEVSVSLPVQFSEPLEVTAFVYATCTSSRMINYLDPQATRRYLEVDYEPYRAHLREYFGDPIEYVFFDHPYGGFYRWAEWEGSVTNSLMYTEHLLDAYETIYSEDIRLALLSLVVPVGVDTPRLRCQFFDVYGKLGRANFFGQVERWAKQNGLGVAGHELLGYVGAWSPTAGFPDIDVRTNFGADYFEIDRFRTLTTVDACNYHPQVSAKFGDSVARAHGRTGCMLEQYAVGVNGRATAAGQWDVTLNTVRAAALRHQVFGCRQFIFHGFYQTDGRGDSFEGLLNPRFDFAPGINYEPWFAEHAHFAAESAGLSAFFDGAASDARLAVLYPLYTCWAEGSAHPFAEHSGFWFRALLEAGLPYDIVDERELELARIDRSQLILPSGSYSGLVLPGVTTVRSWSTVHKLEEFARAGGAILASGPTLQASQETGQDPLLEKAFSDLKATYPSVLALPDLPEDSELPEVIARFTERIALPAVIAARPAGPGTVWMRTGCRKGESLVALFNDGPVSGQVRLRLPLAGSIMRYWPGEQREEEWPWYQEEGTTAVVTVDLEPMELACLRFPEQAAERRSHILSCSAKIRGFEPVSVDRRRAAIVQSEPAPVTVLVEAEDTPAVLDEATARILETEDGAWQVTVGAPPLPEPLVLGSGWKFRPENKARSKSIDVHTGWEVQGYAGYSGTGIYTCTFDLPLGFEAFDWEIRFPGLVSTAEVSINGRKAGSCYREPYRVAIPFGMLSPGPNQMTVKVRNTAGNRYYHNTPFEGEAPTPSGILGAPVLHPSATILLEF